MSLSHQGGNLPQRVGTEKTPTQELDPAVMGLQDALHLGFDQRGCQPDSAGTPDVTVTLAGFARSLALVACHSRIAG